MITTIIGATCVICVIVALWSLGKLDDLQKHNKNLEKDFSNKSELVGKRDAQIEELVKSNYELGKNTQRLECLLIEEHEKYDNLLHQKKSSEINLGLISETLTPFLKNFPYNPEDCRFLGQPLDYIIFDILNKRIVFLEVKSGNSRLSKTQKAIRDIILKKNVEWAVYRVK